MTKVHTLYRIVETHLGSAYSHPVKTFETQELAKEAMGHSNLSFAELLQGTILVHTPQGPKKAMTVKQLLNEMGIATLAHNILSQDVHGAIVLAPNGVQIQ